MPSLARRILEHAGALPEATPLRAADLGAFGKPASVRRVLARLAGDGRLCRICRGIYMRPVETRFGRRWPAAEKAVPALAELWGETVAPCGGACANMLGLTTQNPIRAVYLTSGPERRLRFARHEVLWRRAPRWQLAAPGRRAGAVVRALAFFGPNEIDDALTDLKGKLSAEDRAELAATLAIVPGWMAGPARKFLARA